MNGIDYQKALSKQQRSMWKTMKDQKVAYDSNLKNLNNQYETNIKNQKEDFSKHKADLEKKVEDRYEKMNNASQQSLLQKNKQYQEQTDKIKEDFSNLTRANLQNFNKKFTSLKRQFDDTIGEERQNNKEINKQLSRSYDERVDAIRKGADKEINNYLSNAKGSGESLKNTFDIEKKELISKNAKATNKLMKSELEKRNLLKEKAVGDIQEMLELTDRERILNKERQRANFQRVIGDANFRVSKMESKMKEERERMIEIQSDEVRKQNREFAKRFSEQEKRNNINIRDLERKNRMNGIGSGSTQQKLSENRRKIEQGQLKEKSELLISQRDKVLQDTAKKLEKADEKFREDLKELKMDQAEKLSQKDWQQNLILEKVKTEDRLKRADLADTFNESLRNQKSISDKRLINEKKIYNQKVDNLKDNYRKEMSDAVIRSDIKFSEYKKVAASQKAQLQRRLNKANTEEKDLIKEQYEKKIEDIKLGFEKKISQLEVQNEVLSKRMDANIKDISRDSKAEIERQTEEVKKSSDARVLAEKEAANQKVKQLKKDLTKIQLSYDKKMNDQRILSQRRLRQTSFNYEQVLKNERKRYQDIIDQNNRYFTVELSRLKAASSEEKERIVNKYEDQISKMNEIFQRRQEEMERFVVLSKTT